MSFVYGQQRSFKARTVHGVHHTGAHGQRYEVDQVNFDLLPALVTKGRQQIHNWILKHYDGRNEKDKILKNFDSEFLLNFSLADLPE